MRLILCFFIGALISQNSFADPSLFVCEKNRISQYDISNPGALGAVFPLESTERICKIESQGEKIYVLAQKRIWVWDVKQQEAVEILLPEEIQTAQDLVILPNNNFALLDNQRDRVHIIDQAGSFQRTIEFLETPNAQWQSINGIVVDNKLVISEDGGRRVLKIDLNSYSVSVLKDFSEILRDYLGPIAYTNGTFYIAQRKTILSFSEDDGKLTLVAELPEGNITGIAIFDKSAFVSTNGITTQSKNPVGSVYKLDLSSGKSEKWIEQLYYPMDIVIGKSEF